MTWIAIGLRLFLVLAVQVAALGWMIFERAHRLRTGEEVTISLAPIDPRDLFRGDYVRLRYEISTVYPQTVGGDTDFERNDPVWIALEPDETGRSQPTGVFKHPPPPLPDRTVIQGRVRSAYNSSSPANLADRCPRPCTRLSIEYGIENFFVPEGEGRKIETIRDTDRVAIVAAIDSNGKAAIKTLLIDGEERYSEPLF